MKAEIPFSFLRDIRNRDVSISADSQELNKLLRQKGVPINIGCLDVLISLWTLPLNSCQFEGLFDDMITLSRFNSKFDQPPDKTDIQKRQLKSRLEYLEQYKMIKIDKKERYRMTKKGQEVMEKARLAIT